MLARICVSRHHLCTNIQYYGMIKKTILFRINIAWRRTGLITLNCIISLFCDKLYYGHQLTTEYITTVHAKINSELWRHSKQQILRNKLTEMVKNILRTTLRCLPIFNEAAFTFFWLTRCIPYPPEIVGAGLCINNFVSFTIAWHGLKNNSWDKITKTTADLYCESFKNSGKM